MRILCLKAIRNLIPRPPVACNRLPAKITTLLERLNMLFLNMRRLTVQPAA